MNAQSLIVGLFVLAAAGGAQAQTLGAGGCELHVWPTENYLGMSTGLLSGFGAVGAAAEYSAKKGRMETVKGLNARVSRS